MSPPAVAFAPMSRELADVITVEGGHPIRGEVAVRGAKNSISKQLVASLLTDRQCVLHNTPAIADTRIVADMLRAMGVEVETGDDGAGTVQVHARDVIPMSVERAREFAGVSRIPILLCGPLLHRTGEALIPSLGGDDIGTLYALESL